MTRWTLLAAAALVGLGVVTVAVARRLGRSGSRASVLVSVVSGWLAAWILWGFAGGLAVRGGYLERYDDGLFAVLAVGGGLCQYRVQVQRGREPGLAVFVGGQLVWLLVLLARNGGFW